MYCSIYSNYLRNCAQEKKYFAKLVFLLFFLHGHSWYKCGFLFCVGRRSFIFKVLLCKLLLVYLNNYIQHSSNILTMMANY